MSQIDFTATIKDPNDIATTTHYKKIKKYFIGRAKQIKSNINSGKTFGNSMLNHNRNIRWAFFTHFLYHSCRRISEIIGKQTYNFTDEKGRDRFRYNPLGNYHGVRFPDDIDFETGAIRFGILKKGHIKKKILLKGVPKDKQHKKLEEAYLNKKPKFVWKKYPSWFMDSLKNYCDWAVDNKMIGNTYKYPNDKRLFPFSTNQVDVKFRQVCIHLDIGIGEPELKRVHKLDENGVRIHENGKPLFEMKMVRRSVHSHAWRHGFNSRAVQAMSHPKDIFTLMRINEHSSTRQTEGYVSVFGGEQEALMDNMKKRDEA